MYALGLALSNGEAGEADEKAACDWYERAAEHKYADAVNNLAICFWAGEGRTQNQPKALELYETAGSLGSTVSYLNLGEIYAEVGSQYRDEEKATTNFLKSARGGNVSGMRALGHRLFDGLGIKADPATACDWFIKAATLTASEQPSTLNIAGYCEANGLGRRKNIKKAATWFLKAAEAGDLNGMRNIALRLDEGKGIKRNRAKAAEWFRKALRNGNVSALNEFISSPFAWSTAFRRELQNILKREGLYDGPTNGKVSKAFDHILWTKAQGKHENASPRLIQSFEQVKRPGLKEGLLVRVCRRPSNRPQRLMIMNHGLTSRSKERRIMRPDSCGPVAEYFADLGYVIAFPLRRGYGATGGRFVEGATRYRCGKAFQFEKAGKEIASDIHAAMEHLIKLPFVQERNAIVFGHSGGGWGTIALSSKNDPRVAGFVNFSGAHGSRKGRPNGNCGTAAVAAAAQRFGKTARSPSLWLYVENDTYIGPGFARRLNRAFQKSGGVADFRLLKPYGDEGHYLVEAKGLDIWGPIVAEWLKDLQPRKQLAEKQTDSTLSLPVRRPKD